MLLEDVLEPVARDIADFLSTTGAAAGSSWKDYHRNEDLIPLKRWSDDAVGFVRAKNHEARLVLSNIKERDPDPKTLIFHSPIVLESERKATASIEISNLDGDLPQSYTFKKQFKTGSSEEAAVQAGFSVEDTTKAEVGGEASQFKLSKEFKTTVSSQWTNATGTTKDETTGGDFPLIAAPRTYVKAFLQWEEQTLQRRIECDGTYDFKIELGRYHRYKKYDAGKARRTTRESWTSGSPVRWESLEHLIAVAEKRGSIHYARYEHYAKYRDLNPVYMERIRAARQQHIDRLTPAYKGAAAIKVVIETLETANVD